MYGCWHAGWTGAPGLRGAALLQNLGPCCFQASPPRFHTRLCLPAAIARCRTDNAVKNRWHALIKKHPGLDPEQMGEGSDGALCTRAARLGGAEAAAMPSWSACCTPAPHVEPLPACHVRHRPAAACQREGGSANPPMAAPAASLLPCFPKQAPRRAPSGGARPAAARAAPPPPPRTTRTFWTRLATPRACSTPTAGA